MYLRRDILPLLRDYLTIFPAVGIVGPRQIGKTSLVQESLLGEDAREAVLYLDLEREADRARLSAPSDYFEANPHGIVIIDEVQRAVGLFPELRGIIDRDRRPGRFVLLGSASPTLLRTSGESLAGRIGYVELHGLSLTEGAGVFDVTARWVRGGFPLSLLADSDLASSLWRENFVRTYIERDLPVLGLPTSPALTRRMWTMLAHLNGQLLNVQSLCRALDLDTRAIKRYLDFFEEAYLIRRLPPYFVNVKKRLVKSPKLYVRDSGLLHTLLGIGDFNALSGRPELGPSWESLCVELAATHLATGDYLSFYRTARGAEIDLIVERGGRPHLAIEIKASSAPSVSKGFYIACDDLGVERRYVLGMVEGAYSSKGGVEVIGLGDLPRILGK